ncbi:MAG TPA: hypothetical protein PLV64_22425 [Anaerolineales bacterium]|nr:hypothetical protein [Anaerolineales bacterium]
MTQATPPPLPQSMAVIVRSNAIAHFPNGQVVINLRRHPADQQARKMNLALSTFREYGWAIEDQRKMSTQTNTEKEL